MPTSKNTYINGDRLSLIFGALGDAGRFKIFTLLLKNKKQNFCVTEIAQKMGTSVPAASHQLKIMEMVGLIKHRRVGKMVCYEASEDSATIKELIKIIKEVDK